MTIQPLRSSYSVMPVKTGSYDTLQRNRCGSSVEAVPSLSQSTPGGLPWIAAFAGMTAGGSAHRPESKQ